MLDSFDILLFTLGWVIPGLTQHLWMWHPPAAPEEIFSTPTTKLPEQWLHVLLYDGPPMPTPVATPTPPTPLFHAQGQLLDFFLICSSFLLWLCLIVWLFGLVSTFCSIKALRQRLSRSASARLDELERYRQTSERLTKLLHEEEALRQNTEAKLAAVEPAVMFTNRVLQFLPTFGCAIAELLEIPFENPKASKPQSQDVSNIPADSLSGMVINAIRTSLLEDQDRLAETVAQAASDEAMAFDSPTSESSEAPVLPVAAPLESKPSSPIAPSSGKAHQDASSVEYAKGSSSVIKPRIKSSSPLSPSFSGVAHQDAPVESREDSLPHIKPQTDVREAAPVPHSLVRVVSEASDKKAESKHDSSSDSELPSDTWVRPQMPLPSGMVSGFPVGPTEGSSQVPGPQTDVVEAPQMVIEPAKPLDEPEPASPPALQEKIIFKDQKAPQSQPIQPKRRFAGLPAREQGPRHSFMGFKQRQRPEEVLKPAPTATDTPLVKTVEASTSSETLNTLTPLAPVPSTTPLTTSTSPSTEAHAVVQPASQPKTLMASKWAAPVTTPAVTSVGGGSTPPIDPPTAAAAAGKTAEKSSKPRTGGLEGSKWAPSAGDKARQEPSPLVAEKQAAPAVVKKESAVKSPTSGGPTLSASKWAPQAAKETKQEAQPLVAKPVEEPTPTKPVGQEIFAAKVAEKASEEPRQESKPLVAETAAAPAAVSEPAIPIWLPQPGEKGLFASKFAPKAEGERPMDSPVVAEPKVAQSAARQASGLSASKWATRANEGLRPQASPLVAETATAPAAVVQKPAAEEKPSSGGGLSASKYAPSGNEGSRPKAPVVEETPAVQPKAGGLSSSKWAVGGASTQAPPKEETKVASTTGNASGPAQKSGFQGLSSSKWGPMGAGESTPSPSSSARQDDDSAVPSKGLAASKYATADEPDESGSQKRGSGGRGRGWRGHGRRGWSGTPRGKK